MEQLQKLDQQINIVEKDINDKTVKMAEFQQLANEYEQKSKENRNLYSQTKAEVANLMTAKHDLSVQKNNLIREISATKAQQSAEESNRQAAAARQAAETTAKNLEEIEARLLEKEKQLDAKLAEAGGEPT